MGADPALFLSVFVSPACSITSERERPSILALNNVIYLLIYASHQKCRIFYIYEEEIKKAFWGEYNTLLQKKGASILFFISSVSVVQS